MRLWKPYIIANVALTVLIGTLVSLLSAQTAPPAAPVPVITTPAGKFPVAFPNSPIVGLHDVVATIRGIDVGTTAGEQQAKTAILKQADTTVALCLKYHIGRVIAWTLSCETLPGSKYNSVAYVGDPRIAPKWADQCYDAMFAKFSVAGIRTGCLIRHGEIVESATGVTRVEGQDVQPAIVKALYAQSRWGCNAFYIDTNEVYGATLPLGLAARFVQQVPGCSAIWEQANPNYGNDRGMVLWDARNGLPQIPGIHDTLIVFLNVGGASPADQAKLPAYVAVGCGFLVNDWFDISQGNTDLAVAVQACKGISY